MRVMCLPDLHCFYDTHSRVGQDGAPTRLVDWHRSTNDLVRIAREFKPHLILAPGDLFVTGNPPTEAILAILGFFTRLEEASGAKVIGIQGNHDPEGWNKAGPVDLVARFGTDWGYTTPQVVNVRTPPPDPAVLMPGPVVQVAVLPWTRPDALRMGAEHQVGNVQAALSQITWALRAQCDENLPKILMGHWAISGCKTANQAVLEGREPGLMLTDLQAQGWDLVVMGHIHTPQVFPGLPLVLHTAALEQRDFGEEGEDRGVYLVDTATQQAEFRPIWHRRFYTWRLDDGTVEEMASGNWPARFGLGGDLAEDVEDAICRVVYKATAEQHGQIDEGALVRALQAAGAAHVAGVYPEIIRATRTRSEGLTEHTQPSEVLAAWLAQRADLSPERKAKVAEVAELLEREGQNDETDAN